MNLSELLGKYEVMQGKFECQNCQEILHSARFYTGTLDITWKCKVCEFVSTVNIFKERGY